MFVQEHKVQFVYVIPTVFSWAPDCIHKMILCILVSHACSILLCNESSSSELRDLIAGVITSQPEVYSSAILEREPADYVTWIQQADSWGG